jgi:(2Fe-2S) ferredoxin
MDKPEYHFLVCNSFRLSGEPQGTCHKKDAPDLLQHLENEVVERGLDAMVSSTGCLKMCERGPVMVVYPAGLWFAEVTEDKIDQILDAIEEGEPVEELALT